MRESLIKCDKIAPLQRSNVSVAEEKADPKLLHPHILRTLGDGYSSRPPLLDRDGHVERMNLIRGRALPKGFGAVFAVTRNEWPGDWHRLSSTLSARFAQSPHPIDISVRT